MNHLNINLSDATIVSCLEFSEFSTTIEDAVTYAIEALTEVMRKDKHLNTYGPDELNAIILNFKQQPTEAIDDPSAFQAIALQVEETIEAGATADIAKSVEIGEHVEHVISAPRINLYNQLRKPFSVLKEAKPNDRLIVEYVARMSKEYKPGDVMQEEDRLYSAALELVYSNTTEDLWSSEIVEKQIKKLMALHLDANKFYDNL